MVVHGCGSAIVPGADLLTSPSVLGLAHRALPRWCQHYRAKAGSGLGCICNTGQRLLSGSMQACTQTQTDPHTPSGRIPKPMEAERQIHQICTQIDCFFISHILGRECMEGQVSLLIGQGHN